MEELVERVMQIPATDTRMMIMVKPYMTSIATPLFKALREDGAPRIRLAMDAGFAPRMIWVES